MAYSFLKIFSSLTKVTLYDYKILSTNYMLYMLRKSYVPYVKMEFGTFFFF